jgi:probable HAF family extracellular repeat protein
VALLAAASTACHDGPTESIGPNDAYRAAIEMSALMVAGRSQALRLTYLRTFTGAGLWHPRRVTWTSSDTHVLWVSPDGKVSARAAGRAMLVARTSARSDTLLVEVLPKGYQVTYLRTLGGAYSEALDVNDAGVVVGNASTASGDTVAFRWSGAAPVALGGFRFPGRWGTFGKRLPGGSSLIDAAGRVVGTAQVPAPPGAVATAISASGETAGYWPATAPGRASDSAFVVVHGTVTRLTQSVPCGPVPGPVPASRNDAGQVVGSVSSPTTCSAGIAQSAAVWSDPGTLWVAAGGYMVLPAAATAVNSRGVYVYWLGCHECYRNSSVVGYFAGFEGPTPMQPLALAAPVYPLDLNDGADVVGTAEAPSELVIGSPDAPYHGFLWRGGLMGDLNELVEGTDWEIVEAAGINRSGQIAATGRNRVTGQTGALLLTPLR